jgi:hypothetical protein
LSNGPSTKVKTLFQYPTAPHLLCHSKDWSYNWSSPDLSPFGGIWQNWRRSPACISTPIIFLITSLDHLHPRPISGSSPQATLVCELSVIDEEGPIKNSVTTGQIRISQGKNELE